MTNKQIDRFLDIFDRAVKVAERWAEREYPESNGNEECFISRVGEKHIPKTEAEYKEFEAEETGRFETKFNDR